MYKTFIIIIVLLLLLFYLLLSCRKSNWCRDSLNLIGWVIEWMMVVMGFIIRLGARWAIILPLFYVCIPSFYSKNKSELPREALGTLCGSDTFRTVTILSLLSVGDDRTAEHSSQFTKCCVRCCNKIKAVQASRHNDCVLKAILHIWLWKWVSSMWNNKCYSTL